MGSIIETCLSDARATPRHVAINEQLNEYGPFSSNGRESSGADGMKARSEPTLAAANAAP